LEPQKPITLHVAGKTDVGLIREHNEDNFMVVDIERESREVVDGMRAIEVGSRGALLVVCDGMGGAAAGEVASQMAVDAVFREMSAKPASPDGESDRDARRANFARRMRSAAFTANQLIFDASRADNARAGMGTTMTTVGIVDDSLVMAQVGDSRAYVLRGDRIVQVTRDQSLVNQLLETGQITEEQARLFEHSNVILQALGVQPDVEVLLSTVRLKKGDRVVVCSDGLTGVVSDEELGAIVGASDDVAESCRLLVEMARSAGGPDNITVIVARFEGESIEAATEVDVVAYERWRLDEPETPAPAPGPAATQLPSLADDGEPATESGEPPAPRPMRQAEVFFSSMLLVALALGSVILASLLYRSAPAVDCTVSSAPGLAIRVDGRDTGARTQGGSTELRLPPGIHRVSLHGPGAPAGERTLDVPGDGSGAAAGACQARFDTGGP
jgi:serine/threonine protein phosphatase PrpC